MKCEGCKKEAGPLKVVDLPRFPNQEREVLRLCDDCEADHYNEDILRF